MQPDTTTNGKRPETSILEKKIISFDKACTVSQKLHQESKKLVFTSGVFDIIHIAHLHYLLYLRRKGHMLIVGIDDNEGVQKIKGEMAPFFHEYDRAVVIANLWFVDYVFIFPGVWSVEQLMRLQPDYVGLPSFDPNMEDKLRKINLAQKQPIITPPFLHHQSSTRKARQVKNDYLFNNTIDTGIDE